MLYQIYERLNDDVVSIVTIHVTAQVEAAAHTVTSFFDVENYTIRKPTSITTTTTPMSAEQVNATASVKAKNNVQVASRRDKTQFVFEAAQLLNDGEAEVVITALGQAISDAADVVQQLKDNGVVAVKRINTSRGEVESARRRVTDKIEITVVKSATFDVKYAELVRQQEEKKSESN